MTVKIYNPRHLLRKGSAEMMNDAARGDIVLLRNGLLSSGVRTEHTGNAVNFTDSRGKVFRLVECTEDEVKEYEKLFAAQE